MDGADDGDGGRWSWMISDVDAPGTVGKESGDIEVERVRDVTKISSQTGQMKLHDIVRLEIEECDGNLEVVNTGPSRIRNRGGNLRISNVKGTLEIEDESGEIQVSDVDGEVKIRDTSGQIRVSHVGSVVIDDTSGDITVRQ